MLLVVMWNEFFSKTNGALIVIRVEVVEIARLLRGLYVYIIMLNSWF